MSFAAPQIPGIDPEKHYISRCENAPLLISRVHRVPANQVWRLGVLGAIAGVVVIVYLIIFLLFILRLKTHPLKQRSPALLLFSAISGTIALAYMYFRQFLDLVLVCPISYYIMELFLMLFFMPYLLRCYRTIMIWKYNQAKASIMSDQAAARDENEKLTGDKKTMNAASQSNLFVVKYRWAYSEKFLVFMLIVMSIAWLIIGIIVQVVSAAAAGVWNPFCQKKCNLEEGFALRIFLIMCEVLIFIYLFLVFLMRNIDDDFSIRNELLVLCLFSLVTVSIMIIIVWIPGLGWPEQPYVGYVLGIELIGSFIISVCYPLFKSFTRDIYFSDFLGKITGKKPDSDAVNAEMDENQSVQPVQEIASVTSPQVDKPLLTPQTPSDVQPNTTDKQPEQNVDVNTQQQQQQDQSKPEDAPKIEEEKPAENNTTTTPPTTDTQANTAANKKPATAKPTQTLSTNKEFDEFLTNKDAKEVFKQFLVREFSVENLMFYTEVQYFKKLTDQEEIEETSNQIYETYVQAGAPFEINISADKRSKVEQFVKSKPVPLDAFFEAEKAVYTAMEKESFPRFQKNKLYLNYKKEFGSNIASKKPTSAKKPPPKKK